MAVFRNLSFSFPFCNCIVAAFYISFQFFIIHVKTAVHDRNIHSLSGCIIPCRQPRSGQSHLKNTVIFMLIRLIPDTGNLRIIGKTITSVRSFIKISWIVQRGTHHKYHCCQNQKMSIFPHKSSLLSVCKQTVSA